MLINEPVTRNYFGLWLFPGPGDLPMGLQLCQVLANWEVTKYKNKKAFIHGIDEGLSWVPGSHKPPTQGLMMTPGLPQATSGWHTQVMINERMVKTTKVHSSTHTLVQIIFAGPRLDHQGYYLPLQSLTDIQWESWGTSNHPLPRSSHIFPARPTFPPQGVIGSLWTLHSRCSQPIGSRWWCH